MAAALKLVSEGNKTRGPLPATTEGTAQAMIPVEMPPMPDRIAKHPTAKRAWEQIVPSLYSAGIVSISDGPAIELAVLHYAISCKAAEVLLQDGPTIENRYGEDIKHPADVVFRGESKAFLMYCQQLGLTFAARTRARVASQEDLTDDNPFS